MPGNVAEGDVRDEVLPATLNCFNTGLSHTKNTLDASNIPTIIRKIELCDKQRMRL